MTDNHRRPSAADIDTSRPHTARMYDYYLGGKDNFPPDAEAAEQVRALFPEIGTVALENRRFMHRATRTLASEGGVRQFVDIGTGIPTEPNLHQVAQRMAPEARVVYVDHDPLVLDHADALMHSTLEGRTRFVLGDLRHDAILDHPELREVINLNEPVALSLVALLHFVPDAARPHQIVRDLVGRLCSGSFLVLSHVTHDPAIVGEQAAQAWKAVQEIYRRGGTPAQARTEADIRTFFDGLDLIDPGLTLTHRWRPGPEHHGITAAESSMLAAVAHKP